jgi:molybdopterin/thiamine biosynthesis adenylyltransferase
MLANFFDRVATSAAQVLHGFDLDIFQAKLHEHVVGVAFDAAAGQSREGKITLELAVNLFSRLYPKLALIPLGRGAEDHTGFLSTVARSINPHIQLLTKVGKNSPCVVVGDTKAKGGGHRIYLGSDGWIARLSSATPVGSRNTSVPFGAAAAACFGVANVFRIVFAEQLPQGPPDDAFQLSLFNYEQGSSTTSNPSLRNVDLGSTSLVGVGAVGNGFVWALARTPDLIGTLHLVDHELVELSNLQRYVLTSQAHRGTKKVELAAQQLAREGLNIVKHEKRWGWYAATAGDTQLERVAVAVDSAKDRVAVQGALPRWIFNAWTQTDDLGVSRHSFLGDNACLVCLYLPDRKQVDEDEIVAKAMGLPHEQREIRRLLYYNAPVARELLLQVATALAIAPEHLLAFEGRPMRTFYSEAFCGGAIFRATKGARLAEAIVPMGFQSALSGVMLAAEVVAHAAGLKDVPPPVTSTINLLRPLAPYLSFDRKKDREGRCVCQDPDYIDAYRAKWRT